jgi:hypothetical protein
MYLSASYERSCASPNVVLPTLDFEADPETLLCESLKVVVFPDLLAVVEILPDPSLSVAFLSASVSLFSIGSEARTSTGRSRRKSSSIMGF